MNKDFGGLRGLLQLETWSDEDKQTFIRTAEKLKNESPAQYQKEYLPYIQGFKKHFDDAFLTIGKLEELFSIGELLPHVLLKFSPECECCLTNDYRSNPPSPHELYMKTLCHLELAGAEIPKQSILELFSSPHLHNLKYLSLSGYELDDDVVCAIAQSESLYSLEVLNLYSCPIGDVSAEALATSTTLKSLKELYLSYGEIGHQGAMSLMKFQERQLHTLQLKHHPIGNIAFGKYINSKWFVHDSCLDLSYYELDCDGMRILTESNVLQNVTHLDLSYNPLGDRGAQILIQSGYVSNLELLDVNSTKITAEGAQLLSDAMKHSSSFKYPTQYAVNSATPTTHQAFDDDDFPF